MKSEADPEEIRQGWQRQLANLPVITNSLRELILTLQILSEILKFVNKYVLDQLIFSNI